MRLRQIKQYGNTYLIKLEPTDLDDLKLKLNDKVDIEDLVKKEDKKSGDNNKRDKG